MIVVVSELMKCALSDVLTDLQGSRSTSHVSQMEPLKALDPRAPVYKETVHVLLATSMVVQIRAVQFSLENPVWLSAGRASNW
jgi:hypothetical protein